MPRGVYKRTKHNSPAARSRRKVASPKQRRRKNTPGVVEIPTISRAQLIRSSINPSIAEGKSVGKAVDVFVGKGDRLTIHFI